MADDRAKSGIQRWDTLDGDASTFKIGWQDIANYMNPLRNDYIIDKAPGMKRMQYVFDSAPILALMDAAAGLHARLTPPWEQWGFFHVDDDKIDQIGRVRAWLQAVDDDLFGLYSSPKHNFTVASHELYRDVLMIGTSAMAVLDSSRSGVLFSTRHMKECRVAENEEERVDELWRKWQWTARQAVTAWGEKNVGEKVAKAYKEKPDTPFHFIHGVYPRQERNPNRADAMNKPYASLYVAVDEGVTIAEGGFEEFPYMVPRLDKIAGEKYGRGPGWTALPDVKMLNEMVKTLLKAAQKIVDPPLQLPDDGFLVPIKTTPASLNFYRANTNPNNRISPIETKGDVPIGLELINALREQIRRIFTASLNRMPGADNSDPTSSPGKNVTATFVNQDTQERGMIQSPMLARMDTEFTGPLNERVFNIRWRQSVARRFGPGSPFPPPPPELSGKKLVIEYKSPVAMMMKAGQLDAIGAVMQAAQLLAQFDPTIKHAVNAYNVLQIISRDRNAPADVLNSQDVFQAKVQADQAMAQQTAQHEQLANMAGAAKDGSAALKNVAQLPPQALQQLTQQPQQQAA